MKNLKLTLFILASFLLMTNIIAQDAVMNYTELQTYLPSNVSGYVAGELGGSTMTMQGMSFSNAEIEFTKTDGSWIRITLLDYSGAVNMYQAATAMWSTGMSFENDESVANSVQWSDNIVGWEEYRKKDNEAHLALGIGERFFLSIEANNQTGMSLVTEIGNSMDLESLATQ